MMKSTSRRTVSPAVAKALAGACPAGQDYLTLNSFIATVLYHPDIGYYRSNRKRIGRAPETDFFTASSIHGTFGSLVIESIRRLLDDKCDEFVFVEIGPETDQGILGTTSHHPFKSIKLLHPGDSLRIPQKSIVFSNELFDAQPFRRFIYTSGSWKELGVRVLGNQINWCVIDSPTEMPALPVDSAEGYVVDWPQGCHDMLREIVSQQWSGLFLAFDYGLDTHTILTERPQGTGRTYSGHRMGTDLLDRPGEMDITHHIIWDIMEQMLISGGFKDLRLLTQEKFFMEFARAHIQRVMESSPQGFDREKQSLMELLHPANMGHKFQVLCALRREY